MTEPDAQQAIPGAAAGAPYNGGASDIEIDIVLDRLRDQAQENANRWGCQDDGTQHHALTEELGEWSKAVLESEGPDREASEAIDAAAVLVAIIVDADRRSQADAQ